jgi:hypothetical protein
MRSCQVVGYELIHNTSMWLAFGIIIVLPILILTILVLLLDGYANNWWAPRRPSMDINYGRVNTDWLAPDTNKHKEIEVTGVPVLYYKKVVEGYKIILTTTMECPKEIDWSGKNFSWIWIVEAKRMGWKQANPPARPSLIASPGMMAHVDRILLAEHGTKPTNVTLENPLKWAKTGTKTSITM